jgi:hypothetical protein
MTPWNALCKDASTLLYRGVSADIHDEGRGLLPRNRLAPFRRVVSYDGQWNCDKSVIHGGPVSQAVHAHQWDSERFSGPGLSFSKSQTVARRFATVDGLVNGVVYVVDASALIAAGFLMFEPSGHTREMQNPDEAEVIVVAPVGMDIPAKCVVQVIRVE